MGGYREVARLIESSKVCIECNGGWGERSMVYTSKAISIVAIRVLQKAEKEAVVSPVLQLIGSIR